MALGKRRQIVSETDPTVIVITPCADMFGFGCLGREIGGWSPMGRVLCWMGFHRAFRHKVRWAGGRQISKCRRCGIGLVKAGKYTWQRAA